MENKRFIKADYLIVFCTLIIGILFFLISSSMADKNNWKIWGGYDNPIDQYHLTIIQSCETDGHSSNSLFTWAQTSFLYSWGTDTDQLFEMLFDSMESDYLADYQDSMSQWMDALDSRFWFSPEELNAVAADFNGFYSGNGVLFAIQEEKGWIMRLYALQLRTVLENCPEIKVVEAEG